MTIRDLIDSGKISLDTVVLGELPMTADGVVIGDEAVVWDESMGTVLHYCTTEGLYSTRQAAERAAKETTP